EVAGLVRARMQELKPTLPEGVDYAIPFDTTRFVDASIKEVNTTIFEAALLVLAVVFLFLQTWRATLIPMIAVPVSLIGAFAGLWAVGSSINTLTLFALVLAIGIVVDDAIVVPENVERLMRENDMAPFDAAIGAMREVSGAVTAVALLLRHRMVALIAFVTMLAICVGLFLRIPSSFVPSEDQGYIFGNVQLPDGATLERTRKTAGALSDIAQNLPGVDRVFAITG